MSLSRSSMGTMLSDVFLVGNVLSRAMSVLSHQFVLFVLVAGAAEVPSFILTLISPGPGPRPTTGMLTSVVIGGIIALLLIPISQTIVYHGAFQDMLGRPIRFGELLSLALRRFFPVLGASMCMFFVIALGMILLFVPGIIAATMLAVTIPVCVVEQVGPFASIRRSSFLTKGNRWRIFGIGLPAFVASIAVNAVGAALGYTVGGTVSTLLTLVLQAVLGAYTSVLAAVMYHDLRVVREGLDTDRIAAVFD